ncbi:MAG: hypothetical protein LBG27_00845 [Spirochaetaceae bacterium]|nr:hypothetical protein [Spirochaetaceae bacterium]
MKQTFFLRFNIIVGRMGHVWGERYESDILWGGPPEGAEAVDWAEAEAFVDKTPIGAAPGRIERPKATVFRWRSPPNQCLRPNNAPGSRRKKSYKPPQSFQPQTDPREVCPHHNREF